MSHMEKSSGSTKPAKRININEKDSPTKSIINYLQDFGLTEKEAKIYYILY